MATKTDLEALVEKGRNCLKLAGYNGSSALRTAGIGYLCDAIVIQNEEINRKLDLLLERTDPKQDTAAAC